MCRDTGHRDTGTEIPDIGILGTGIPDTGIPVPKYRTSGYWAPEYRTPGQCEHSAVSGRDPFLPQWTEGSVLKGLDDRRSAADPDARNHARLV